MTLEKTLQNLRLTHYSFFNVPNYSDLNLDLLKKVLTFKTEGIKTLFKTNESENYNYMSRLGFPLGKYYIFDNRKK